MGNFVAYLRYVLNYKYVYVIWFGNLLFPFVTDETSFKGATRGQHAIKGIHRWNLAEHS